MIGMEEERTAGRTEVRSSQGVGTDMGVLEAGHGKLAHSGRL